MIKSNFPFMILVAFFISIYSYAQQLEVSMDQSNQEKYDFHYSKHKKLKKTGFILLGVGLGSTAAGLLVANNTNGLFDDSDNGSAGVILILGGTLTTISSVPVFIVSGSQKRKAEAFVQVRNYEVIDFTYPNSKLVSVGFKIEF